jgi:hypothetical protein
MEASMNEIKIDQCRKHWQSLSPHIKERATAKHLLAAIEVAERFMARNNRLEMECQQMRMTADNPAIPTCATCLNNRPYAGVMCHQCKWWPHLHLRDHYHPDSDLIKP